MEPAEYLRLSHLEHNHWWYVGMNNIAAQMLKRMERPTETHRILDAGCGTGGSLTWLKEFGAAYGIDHHVLAMSLAKEKGHRRISRATVSSLPFAEATFDVVTSFDVLYHVDVSDDVAALKEMARVMVPGGVLLFRLPAIKWLCGSPHDRVVHTRHRYTRGEVTRKINEAGIEPVRITYANTILFLPAMLWRLAGIATASGKSSDLRDSGSVIDRACAALLRLEAMVLNFADFPIGLSVFAIAKKGRI